MNGLYSITFYPAYIHLLLAGLFGLLAGSFLNCLTHRLPIMLNQSWTAAAQEYLELPTEQPPPPFNLITPRSHCPTCARSLPWWLLIPVFSYLAVCGKCHSCKSPISITYPLVEIVSAWLCVLIVHTFGISLDAFALIAASMLMFSLLLIDGKHQILPDVLVYALLWSGLIYHFYTQQRFYEAFIGCIAGYGFFYVLYIASKAVLHREALGMGDIKLLAALGAWAGYDSLITIIFVGSVTGLLFNLLTATLRMRNLHDPMPFGPFLLIPAWLCIYFGPDWLLDYQLFSQYITHI